MKKTTLVISLACLCTIILGSTFFIVACNKKSSNNTTASSSKRHSAVRLALSDYQQYAITVSDANTLIANYVNDPNLVATTSFQYPAATLLNIINQSDNIVQLHCLLGEQTSGSTTQLDLIFCGVDGNGNHIYLTDGNPSTNYAFENVWPCPVCPITSLQSPNANSAYVNANYTENQLLSNAQTMVAAYQNLASKNTTASTFLLNAADLANYLSNAPNIQTIQFFLGVTSSGTLTLVVAGIDNNGNQIYISNNNQVYAFDNTLPCPTCSNIANGGANLE